MQRIIIAAKVGQAWHAVLVGVLCVVAALAGLGAGMAERTADPHPGRLRRRRRHRHRHPHHRAAACRSCCIRPVVVENKPGAGGSLADRPRRQGAAKDGYTATMLSTGHTVSAAMIKSLPYDPVKDFAPVAMVANVLLRHRHAQGFAGRRRQGPGGARQARPGQAQFRHRRPRLDPAYGRRAVPRR